ncbi:MAG TPA: hypothetical protein V6C78_16395 [Crinalium sp.]|jgi:hypothetical protein
MALAVEVQELAIVVVAKKHAPNILSVDFLKCSGIIASDWELAQTPVLTPQIAQLVFLNGISLIAQVDRVIFVEQIAMKSLSEVSIAQIARSYIQALPQADYKHVGINVQGLVPLGAEVSNAQNYLTQMFLANGAWREFGQAPVQGSLQLRYTLENARLTLSVADAKLQLTEGEVAPILVFSGHFEPMIAPESAKLPQVLQSIASWQSQVELYQELVNTRFLANRGVTAQVLPIFSAIGG